VTRSCVKRTKGIDMTAIEMLKLGAEAYVREMDDAEWEAFRKRVRPPTRHQSPDRNCSTKGNPNVRD
jgi:hypothetical protein